MEKTWALVVHPLSASQQRDNSCTATRRAGIVLLYLSWCCRHLESHEHLVPHFKEPNKGGPRGVEPEQRRRFDNHSVGGSLSIRLGKKEHKAQQDGCSQMCEDLDSRQM